MLAQLWKRVCGRTGVMGRGGACIAAALIAASDAQALPRVAIVAAADASATNIRFTDPQAKLMATGRFELVDIIPANLQTPTLATLQQYNAVIIWSNVNFQDATALGDVMADYVDAGGGVVNAVYSVGLPTAARKLGGRWESGGYPIHTPGTDHSTGSTTLGTISVPGHSIMAGVNSLSSGTTGSRPSIVSMLSHGVLVASWADGRPLVMTSTTMPRRVDLGLYPPSSDAVSGFWVSSTDGAVLMANALVYASDSSGSNPPFATGSANPNIATAGTSVDLTITALSGTNPPSTGLNVTADLQAFGGSASQALNPQGGNVFTYTLSIAANQPGGLYSIPLHVTDAELRTGGGQVSVRVLPQVPGGYVVEVEPNDTRAASQAVTLVNGGGIYGRSTGTSTTVAGEGSADYYTIKTPAMAPGIYRHRMVLTTSGPVGHVGTIRGFAQSNSIINLASDNTVQTSSTTSTPPRFNQWYGFGKQEQLNYRVTGAAATLAEYQAAFETMAVTPLEATTPMTPGAITINRTTGVTTALDLLVFDSNFNPVSDFLADGTNPLTRTYAAGTYYLAVSNNNTCDTRPSPPEATSRSGNVLEHPDAVANSSTTLVTNMSVTFTWIDGTQDVFASKDALFDVQWIKFTVGAATQRCQPADIASDNGTPLPTDLVLNPNGGVNEGDYNSFFVGFFDAAANCDIANDNGTPRPPFGADGVNGGVNEGDYNCFFQRFFDGCPT